MTFKELLQEKKQLLNNRNTIKPLGFSTNWLPELDTGSTISTNPDAEKNSLKQPLSRQVEATANINPKTMLVENLNILQAIQPLEIVDKPVDYLINKFDAVIAGDTEFASRLRIKQGYSSYYEYKKVICDTRFVTVQLAKPNSETVSVYEHPDMGAGLLPCWRGNCALSEFLGFEEIDKPRGKIKTFNIAYLFYFSSFDIFGLFRDKESQIRIARQLLGGRILREKSFPNPIKTGIYVNVPIEGTEDFKPMELALKLFDLKGVTPAGVRGLNGTMDAWGVKFDNKQWHKFFDISNIDREYLNTEELVKVDSCQFLTKHEIVVEYAKGDVKELFTLYDNYHNVIKDVLQKLGLSEYELKNFQTIGNASNQIGIAAILRSLNMNFDKEHQITLAKYLYPSSAYALLDECLPTVEQLLNVDGGYCKNLKPTFPIIRDLVLDMDLKGAYVANMKSLDYCIGIPCVYSYPKDRKFRAKFYDEYKKLLKKKDIIPGCWVARVSTNESLTFKQDLIFSKIFGKSDFEKNLVDDGEGFFVIDESVIDDIRNKKILASIPNGAFQLLNNEIISGIITHDVLQVIEKYWTKKEQKELWEKLEIETLIFYQGRSKLEPDDFKEKFDKLDNTIIHNFENGRDISDKRKPIWTVVETDKGWFGDLEVIRNNIKDEMNNESNPDIKRKLKSSQNGFKNINNSSYGVSGSPFYQTENVREYENNEYGVPKIGNIVFAQNTTARVRVTAWCMSKSLNCNGIITDGGAFNLNHIWLWNWKATDRNSFGSDYLWKLSRYNTASHIDNKSKFGVKAVPLGYGNRWEVVKLDEKENKVTISNGEITITGSEEKWQELDNLAYQHTKNLFGELDIFKNEVIKFSSKNLYKGAAFQSQANYYFETFFNTQNNVLDKNVNYLIKARGYNLSKPTYNSPDLKGNSFEHLYVEMMKTIYYEDTANPYFVKIFSPELLGVDDFNKSESINNDYVARGFLPHSPNFRSSQPSPISLSMFRWNTRKQFELWQKKVESWDRKTGFGIEILFLNVGSILKSEKLQEKQLSANKIIEKLQQEKISYTQIVNRIQDLIDTNTNPDIFDERLKEVLKRLKHPQLIIEERYNKE